MHDARPAASGYPVAPQPSLPAPQLSSQRLLLRASAPELSSLVADYLCRNAAHLSPWEPPRPPDYADPVRQQQALRQEAQAFAQGQLARYWICPQGDTQHIIGQCQVSQLARGPFQNAMLGYSLDARAQGQGLMQEALQTLIQELFGPRVWLHRLQAAVRPDNLRSRRVLERLGFARDGLSPRYLFIAGAWRDHELWSLLNPAWPDELAPG